MNDFKSIFRPSNYVRFIIGRHMTKYDLFSYLKTLYEVEMAQIDLEVVEPRCEFFLDL